MSNCTAISDIDIMVLPLQQGTGSSCVFYAGTGNVSSHMMLNVPKSTTGAVKVVDTKATWRSKQTAQWPSGQAPYEALQGNLYFLQIDAQAFGYHVLVGACGLFVSRTVCQLTLELDPSLTSLAGTSNVNNINLITVVHETYGMKSLSVNSGSEIHSHPDRQRWSVCNINTFVLLFENKTQQKWHSNLELGAPPLYKLAETLPQPNSEEPCTSILSSEYSRCVIFW
jgi:hypothetical protein